MVIAHHAIFQMRPDVDLVHGQQLRVIEVGAHSEQGCQGSMGTAGGSVNVLGHGHGSIYHKS